MALDTYDNLQAAVANWLSRNDLTNEIPDFIRISESVINKQLSITQYESTAQVSAIVGTNEYQLPTDFKSIRAIWSEGAHNRPIRYLTPSQFNLEAGADPGRPDVYTIKSDKILFGPSPDSNYVVFIDYIAMLVPLSVTNQTNFFTDQSPETIFFGALSEAYGFIKDKENYMIWQQRFKESLVALVEMTQDMRYSGVPLEIRSN